MIIAGATALSWNAAPGWGNTMPIRTAQAVQSLPGYLDAAKDPGSDTIYMRITKPGPLGHGVVCSKDYCSHRYSSSQAWNADQSLLLISNGCGGMCFLDGHTYVPLFQRDRTSDCQWHPTNAKLMICAGGGAIFTWAPRTDQVDVKFTSPTYGNLQFGPNKGNPSHDGNRIAVRATRNDGSTVVFGYDLRLSRKFPDIDLGQLPGTNDTCSITPLGINILCSQELKDGSEPTFIFSIDGSQRQKWLEHHRPGHGDMAIDADGNEIYVGISKSDPDRYQVIKRRLSDGKVTSLMRYGEAQHASLRSLARPGWVFLSYGGYPDEVSKHPEWAPYVQEVVALRTDGSGEVRRIATTRNVPSGYWSETHASPSPDGSQVVWSSNWGVAGGPVYDFVSRIDWPWLQTSTKKEIVENALR
jgi:hypothetical protein